MKVEFFIGTKGTTNFDFTEEFVYPEDGNVSRQQWNKMSERKRQAIITEDFNGWKYKHFRNGWRLL